MLADLRGAGEVNEIWFTVAWSWSSIGVQLAHHYFWVVYVARKMNHSVEGVTPCLSLWEDE